MTEHEAAVLSQYSTPGLRKNELTREAKRDHLGSLKVDRSDQQKILSQLYGHLDSELHVSDRTSEPTVHYAKVIKDGAFVIIKPTLDELASRTA